MSTAEVRQVIQQRAAIWAYQKFQLRHPELTSVLYGKGISYAIHVSGPVDDWTNLSHEFDSEIRPLTLSASLVTQIPDGARLVNISSSAADDGWLLHEQLTGGWTNVRNANQLDTAAKQTGHRHKMSWTATADWTSREQDPA